MKSGWWIPLSKVLANELPQDRPFTKLEAMFSLTLDYDQGNPVTVNGYAVLWKWSRDKVRNFMNGVGVYIEYPEATENRQNQRGFIRQITVQMFDRSATDNRQIKFIDSKWLQGNENRCPTDNRQIADRSPDTTINPNPKPIKTLSDFFEKLWQAYPRKDGRKEAERHYNATVKNDVDMERIDLALGNYLYHIKENDIKKTFIKTGKVFFNNWQDWETENEQ